MAKILGVASTPYQLLVFLFIKDAYLSEDEVDLMITDKTASMEELYQSGRLDPYSAMAEKSKIHIRMLSLLFLKALFITTQPISFWINLWVFMTKCILLLPVFRMKL